MIKQYIKRIAIGITQSLMALLYLPIIGMMSSCDTSGKTWEIADNSGSAKEIVLFCGNPGVGKSALCNSIFKKIVFQSGTSVGKGLTTGQQAHLYEGILYIDTPGLSDVSLKEQAASAIENALKRNGNYKIIFVLTCEAGRVRPDDLATVNAVCEAIKTDFEYGLIFNKVTKAILNKLTQNQESLEATYLPLLHKKPSACFVMEKDSNMEDAENTYLTDGQHREKLLAFIAALKSNRIAAEQVTKVDTKGYDETVKMMTEMMNQQLAVMNQMLVRMQDEQREMGYQLRSAQEARYAAEERARDAESGICLIQ